MTTHTAGRIPGRHLLQVPGPTNVPSRVLQAMASPTIDHRGPECGALTTQLIKDMKTLFRTSGDVVMYPSSSTGAWEAAFTNTLSPGDKVLITEVGQFAVLWATMADQLGLDVVRLPNDWRSAANPALISETLAADKNHEIKAVLLTHNETSTGVISDVPAVRAAIDAANHPALFFVDAVSSFGSVEYHHDDWKIDVTIAGSQKGLMMPPGLSFNAISEKALAATQTSKLPCAYFRWQPILEQNKSGFFPYTPPVNMFFALRAAIDMLNEEGMEAVAARHMRHGKATRAAVAAWGLELQCADTSAYSPTVTTIVVPEGHTDEEIRKVAVNDFAMSLGAGLGKLMGKAFRIGHLGDYDDLTLLGALGGVEMCLTRAGIAHKDGGVAAAIEVLQNR